MLKWKNDQLLLWLKNAQYADDVVDAFRSHNITGLTLPLLNSEELKEMGIEPLRLRLSLLKDIQSLLTEKNVSQVTSSAHPLLTQLQSTAFAVQLVESLSRDIREEVLDHGSCNQALASQFEKLREDVLPILKEKKDRKPLPTPEGPGLHNQARPIGGSGNSSTTVSRSASRRSSLMIPPHTPKTPTSPSVSSHHSGSDTGQFDSVAQHFQESPARSIATQDVQSMFSSAEVMTAAQAVRATRPKLVSKAASSHSISSTKSYGKQPEPLKQLRARTEDRCFKIIQQAMKSHGLETSEWNKYALVIVYGDQERVLDYEEKPVVVFRELTEMGLNPSMMLRQVDEADGLDYPELNTPGGRL